MVTEHIKVTQAMVGIMDIPATATQAIPFITAILVIMVTPATIGTWDTQAIQDTEVWGIQDTTIWDIMDTMSTGIWAIIMVGNSDNFKRKNQPNNMLTCCLAGFMFYQLS